MFTPAEWALVTEIFEKVSALSAKDRESILKDLHQTNPKVHDEVVSLLGASEGADAFLEVSAFQGLSVVSSPYEVGERVGDFELKEKIGEGAFGTVFLARQVSLEREVALKITPNVGREGKTMAVLNHENIVRVYLESVDATLGIRFVCMQYIAGLNLSDILERLSFANLSFNGENIAKILGIRNTEFRALSGVELVHRIGSRLCEALSYAHEKRVLHLDLKPSNILIDQNGQVYLSDFNVSQYQAGDVRGEMLGGTPKYMAPEQRRALAGEVSFQSLNEQADIFSLALILQELFGLVDESERESARVYLRVMGGAIETELIRRVKTVSDFGVLLHGASESVSIMNEMPVRGKLLRWITLWPATAFLLAQVVPQLIGSAINISYNSMRIVDNLTVPEQEIFQKLLVAWNPLIYVVCVGILAYMTFPIFRFLRNPESPFQMTMEELTRLRGLVLRSPFYLTLACSIGWAGSAILFPLGIYLKTRTLTLNAFLHFEISFVLSWLVATTYSYINIQFLALRVIYPRLWVGCVDVRKTASFELKHMSQRIRQFQILAGLVPLMGACLMVLVGPDTSMGTHSYDIYRYLLTLFIVMGAAGLFYAVSAAKELLEILSHLTFPKK